jgi:uncharacterized protein YdeI (YjbR/CyaY-like superfamily)
MGKKDPRIDAYIAKSADFAKPILNHIRQLVHKGCPEVEEALKWSMPTFMYKGIVCGIGAFKEHCTFGFWKHKLLFPDRVPSANGEERGMGQFGKITALSELPKDQELLAWIKKAVALNEQGIKVPKPKPQPRKELAVPDYLTAALKKSKKAAATFDAFSYSHKKEYVEWLTEAKREETRQQRLQTTIAWLEKGKPRNWKYMNC